MKKVLPTIAFLCTIILSSAQTPKVYINYVSHNEDNYQQYLNDSLFYVNARTNLIQFANDCQAKGAKWSMGNDYVMLDAIAQWDAPPVTANTNGKNLLRYLAEDKGVECDPHAHADAFNYQDVAYKHTVLGVTPSSVMSGFLFNKRDESNYWWKEYEVPVQSTLDPNFYWAPEVLWGAATEGHTDDPLQHGMWRPADTSDFLSHDPNNHLIAYGNGCRIKITDVITVEEVVAMVDSLIHNIENANLPNDGFYPMSLFIPENNMWTPSYLLKLNAITDSINVRTTQNTIEWMHIEDIVQEWKTNYNGVGFHASCDQQTLIGVEEEEKLDFKVYPNPVEDYLVLVPQNASSNYQLEVYNLQGVLLRKEIGLQGRKELYLSDVPSGVYFIRIQENNKVEMHQLVKK